MTNQELMDIFGFVDVTTIFDPHTFTPKMKFIHKDGSYEYSHNLIIQDIYDYKKDIVN
jgi:hypothetical protein